jgi:hypothetical protein
MQMFLLQGGCSTTELQGHEREVASKTLLQSTQTLRIPLIRWC